MLKEKFFVIDATVRAVTSNFQCCYSCLACLILVWHEC
ncbi:hypothetical protein DSUL_50314 [Desulfovibrionales bacterium]